jgi:uncharacterized protein
MSGCPTCGKSAASRRANPAFPFCSDRCQLIDLGRWLGEEYRIPGRREEVEDEAAPLSPEDDDAPEPG